MLRKFSEPFENNISNLNLLEKGLFSFYVVNEINSKWMEAIFNLPLSAEKIKLIVMILYSDKFFNLNFPYFIDITSTPMEKYVIPNGNAWLNGLCIEYLCDESFNKIEFNQIFDVLSQVNLLDGFLASMKNYLALSQYDDFMHSIKNSYCFVNNISSTPLKFKSLFVQRIHDSGMTRFSKQLNNVDPLIETNPDVYFISNKIIPKKNETVFVVSGIQDGIIDLIFNVDNNSYLEPIIIYDYRGTIVCPYDNVKSIHKRNLE